MRSLSCRVSPLRRRIGREETTKLLTWRIGVTGRALSTARDWVRAEFAYIEGLAAGLAVNAALGAVPVWPSCSGSRSVGPTPSEDTLLSAYPIECALTSRR